MGRKPAYKDGWVLVSEIKPSAAKLDEMDESIAKLEKRLVALREERATAETGDSHIQELLTKAAEFSAEMLRLEDGKLIGFVGNLASENPGKYVDLTQSK